MSVRRIAAAIAGGTIALAVPAAALAGTATPAHHASPRASSAKVITYGGVTMLRVDSGTAKVLAANSISLGLASEARVSKSGIEFPIVGGVVDAKTLAGHINHAGGLTFTAGGKSLTVRDFVIDTVHARLTAWVDQAKTRIPLLDLNLGKAQIKATSRNLSVKNVSATLDKAAAKALNAYYSTNLFKGGLTIGKARIGAKILVAKV